jgi:hypothetical protein
MHRGHEHDHYDHHNGGGGGVTAAGPGHNHAVAGRKPAQWHVPHRSDTPANATGQGPEPDLDLIEAAFVDGFRQASDPTSFLRLAQVPFELTSADGTKLVLLRVEVDAIADVGAITPHLGGTSFRYDPLPARMVSRRSRLRFAYFDGERLRALGLAEVRALASR